MKHAVLLAAVALLGAGCGDQGSEIDPPIDTPPPAPIGFTFEANGERSFASFGWTGLIHNVRVGERTAFGVTTQPSLLPANAGTVGCDAPDGICKFAGPVDPASPVKRRRCLNRMSVQCSSDADCPAEVPSFRRCAYIYDVPVAIPQAGVGGLNGACAFSWIPVMRAGAAPPITGTLDMSSGELNLQNLTLNLVQNGLQTGVATGTFRGGCMECIGDATANDGIKGGRCTRTGRPNQNVDPSPDENMSCDTHRVGAVADFPGNYSMDCSPSVQLGDTENAAFGGAFNSSGFQVQITDTSPPCTHPDYAGQKCFCGMCPDNATACLSNADCGGQQCGFLPPNCNPQPTPLTEQGTMDPDFTGPFAPMQCKNGVPGAATQPNSCMAPGCVWNAETGLGTCRSRLNGQIVGCYPAGDGAKVSAPGAISIIPVAMGRNAFIVDTGNARCTRMQGTAPGFNGLLGLPGLTFQRRSFRIFPEYPGSSGVLPTLELP
jgi:hypothetical protein